MPVFPKISIITPSYNQGQYIEQTIHSVLSQDYPNIEYIIIDGGSTDNTVEVIRKYEKHLKYWVSEPDRGQSHAINKGFTHCTGDIVNWLNSDDWYQPDAFKHIVQLYNENPDKNVFSFRERHIAPNNSININEGTPIFSNLGQAILFSELSQPSTFFKREIWDLLFPLNENLHYIMDGELWIRYLLKYGFKYIIKDDFEIVNFRIHESSKTCLNLQNDGFLKDRASLVLSILQACNSTPLLIYKVHEYYYKNTEYTNSELHFQLTKQQSTTINDFFLKKTIITAINKGEKKVVRSLCFSNIKALQSSLFCMKSLLKTII